MLLQNYSDLSFFVITPKSIKMAFGYGSYDQSKLEKKQ